MALRKNTDVEAVNLRQVVHRAHVRDREGLIGQLSDPDPDARRWAARDLVQEADVVPALSARLLREALFTALAAVGDRAVVQALLPLLRSDDAALRNGAIEVLGGLPSMVAPYIEAQLHDADPDVRLLAVNLLTDLPHEKAAHWASQVLHDDVHVNVVAAAIEVLAEIGAPKHVPVLAAAARKFADAPFIAFAVDVAVERVGAA
jgi:HEAT repeat protein